MSYFLSFTHERPDGEIAKALEAAKSKAVAEFTNLTYQGEYPETGYGIVSIRPKHVVAGGSNWGNSNIWAQCFTTAATWEAWVNVIQTELAFIILTGFWNYEAAPKVVETYITADGRDYPTLNVEETYAYDIPRAYFRLPIIISPDKSWQYYQKTGAGTGLERTGLFGYTLATRSYLILRA